MILHAHKSFASSSEWVFPNVSGNSLAEAAALRPVLNLSKGDDISLKLGQRYSNTLNILCPLFSLFDHLIAIKLAFV